MGHKVLKIVVYLIVVLLVGVNHGLSRIESNLVFTWMDSMCSTCLLVSERGNLNEFTNPMVAGNSARLVNGSCLQSGNLVGEEEKIDEVFEFLDIQQTQKKLEDSKDNIKENADQLSQTSPALIKTPETQKEILEIFFQEHYSPLASQSGIFVWAASRYDLPYSLLPAMAMVESGGCKHTLPNTNNCFGWRPYNRKFNSIQDTIIFTVEWITTKPAYKAFQATRSIEDLGKVYAESPIWSSQVKYWMQKIEYPRTKKET